MSHAQNKELLYGFNDLPQTLLLNPGATVDFNGHIGVPFFSQIHFSAGITGFSTYDIFKDDGRDINLKIQEVIFSLSDADHISVNQQLELFSIGWRKNESTYFSAGVYQELDVINYFPKDLAILVWEGNANNLNRAFNLGDLKFKGELITVYHFGINKVIDKKLTIGARAKLYNSVFNVKSTNNSGTFTTKTSTTNNNFYEQILSADIEVQTSGIKSLTDSKNSDPSQDAKRLLTRSIISGNFGLGIDLGLTYAINEQWETSLSLLDFGAIYHISDTEKHAIKGTYNLEGLELTFPAILQGDETTPYWENLVDDLEEQFDLKSSKQSYVSWRSAKFNAALNYAFGKEISKECDCANPQKGFQNKVGAQLYTIFRPKAPQLAFTGFYYRNIYDFLKLKATYTIDPYSSKNIGLGVSTHIGNFNMYASVNNLLEFQNIAKAQSVSLQLGFNLIFK